MKALQGKYVLTYDKNGNNGALVTYNGGSGGEGVWGSITGTLSDQTDLQTVLDTKGDEITNSEGWKSIDEFKAYARCNAFNLTWCKNNYNGTINRRLSCYSPDIENNDLLVGFTCIYRRIAGVGQTEFYVERESEQSRVVLDFNTSKSDDGYTGDASTCELTLPFMSATLANIGMQSVVASEILVYDIINKTFTSDEIVDSLTSAQKQMDEINGYVDSTLQELKDSKVSRHNGDNYNFTDINPDIGFEVSCAYTSTGTLINRLGVDEDGFYREFSYSSPSVNFIYSEWMLSDKSGICGGLEGSTAFLKYSTQDGKIYYGNYEIATKNDIPPTPPTPEQTGGYAVINDEQEQIADNKNIGDGQLIDLDVTTSGGATSDLKDFAGNNTLAKMGMILKNKNNTKLAIIVDIDKTEQEFGIGQVSVVVIGV